MTSPLISQAEFLAEELVKRSDKKTFSEQAGFFVTSITSTAESALSKKLAPYRAGIFRRLNFEFDQERFISETIHLAVSAGHIAIEMIFPESEFEKNQVEYYKSVRRYRPFNQIFSKDEGREHFSRFLAYKETFSGGILSEEPEKIFHNIASLFEQNISNKEILQEKMLALWVTGDYFFLLYNTIASAGKNMFVTNDH
jgi:hypothetical protein